MKKIMLLAGLWVLSVLTTKAANENNVIFQLNEMEYTDGNIERSLLVFTSDYEAFLQSLTKNISMPVQKKNAGNLKWENIKIDGVGEGIIIEIKDGMLESDKENRTACWSTFENEESKATKLKNISKNGSRMMKIYVSFQNGNDVLRDYDIRKLVEQFLISKA